MNIITPHSLKQQDAMLSDAKITALITGIQFGKTLSGSVWTKRLMHTYIDPEDNFIITSPNYKIMQQSTLPVFLRLMDGYGAYSQQQATFKMYNGGTCYLRTATEPDSIVGITNVRGIYGDEAGKYSLYFWENMQARASFKDCPIMLTTSPYATNWVFSEIIKPTRAGLRPDIKLIQASSNENPYFPKAEFERRKATMDPRRFAALYLGEFSKMHGLVYDCFDPEIHTCEGFQLPFGTKFYAGIDWGFSPDPFVLNVRAITPSGYHYQISEFARTKLTINDMLLIAKQKKQVFGIELFYADPSQPGYIEEFNRNGLSCIPAINDIRLGIDCHYELIRTGQYKVFKNNSPHLLDEYTTYHYPEPKDLETDQNRKEQLPVDQHNHSMDTERYISIMTARQILKKTPQIAGLDKKKHLSNDERIRKLKKIKNKFGGSEQWS